MSPSHDRARFEALFERCYPPLLAYARRRAPSVADADEVTAEVLMVAWRRLDQVPEEHPLPWLYGVARNVARNRLRTLQRHDRLVQRIAHVPPERDDAAVELVREAMAGLDEDDREVLRLAVWEGLSHAEIGVVLGCSANAVGIRLHRARRRLADEARKIDGSAGQVHVEAATGRPDRTE
ncbi:MAG: sigma-70 family RNA polymerase sigma factor [Acidimicrobiia bacterium]|nr:sigma-70 family RNA polymerase sigma factor [Acidimicrobiia bacterium]